MAGPQEMYSFVTKFLNLWQAGKQARLNLECEAGKVSVNLRLHLGHQHPPLPPDPRPPRRPGPSRLRHHARCAKAREASAAQAAAQVPTGSAEAAAQAAGHAAAVQVAVSTKDAAVQATDSVPVTDEVAVQVQDHPAHHRQLQKDAEQARYGGARDASPL